MHRLPLFVLALSLAGCEAPAAPASTAAAATPAAGKAGAPPLDAKGTPRFRPGLWEVVRTDSSEDGPAETTRECVGPEASKDLERLMTAADTPNCRVSRSVTAAGVQVSSDCVQSGVQVKSRLTLTGSETAYQMKLAMDVVSPDGKRDGAEIVGNARWLGACPAGMAPGDALDAEDTDEAG